jgi:RHH-type rel operon transcriptional repressor/antitoxin RelB
MGIGAFGLHLPEKVRIICMTSYTRCLVLAVRIPASVETRLDKLAKLTGRPKSFYVRMALETHLDEIEDTYTALYRLENPVRRWTLDELEQGLDRQG